ncbi:hypothetical protein K2173_025123 [Erythroxylum novogranatense]|uniref:Serine aminopeptidase S33 domain-containing protein n=1 Tax=Erythroxylum novogranatense TaxID=1862640 RepID=A0AAV8SVJ2_9ROSI|nr:hypothetical protein K2173_025123 [Erythroxylum novogranatense]
MSSRSALESCVILTSDGMSLHGRIFKPTHEAIKMNHSKTVFVLVHPYSKLGGCQGLMHGMALRLSIKGFTSITFDMRGVGRSTGRSSFTGFPEIQDVVAVCTWISQNLPAQKILLVGSSAGAAIAGSAIDKMYNIIGYVGMACPFGLAASILFWRHHRAILESAKPKLFIMGTRDGFTSVKQLENKLQNAAGRVETHLIDEVGHFGMEGPAYDAQMLLFTGSHSFYSSRIR